MKKVAQSRRGRMTGRSVRGERFARIPNDVLESEAVTTLHHAAFRVLVIVASGYWGRNNGTQALTEAHARQYGFKGRDTVYRSLRTLTERGLLVQTRIGFKSKTHFALYALGWCDIDNRNGQPLDKPEPAPNRWRDWKSASVPIVGNDESGIHTDGRECTRPAVGNDDPKSVTFHTDGRYAKQPFHTDGREHSENLGGVEVGCATEAAA